MTAVNETNITNGTFNIDVVRPILALKMITEDSSNILNFTWECINYTSTQMILQLNFEHPNRVSISLPRDRLQVTFWGQPLFKSLKGNYVPIAFNVTKTVPCQIDSKRGAELTLIAESVGDVGTNSLITAAIL